MNNAVILTKEFKNKAKIYIDTALLIAVTKDRDDFAIYDGESIKCLSEFMSYFESDVCTNYKKDHIVHKLNETMKKSLQRAIDSKIDRRNYSRLLQDNLSDYFEAFLICLSRGFKSGYLEVVPLLDDSDKVKYYYYEQKVDDYLEKNEVPYSND